MKSDISTKKDVSKISAFRNTLLNAILVLIPILILVVFELFLRMVNYGDDLRLFIPSKVHTGYLEINQKVGKRYFTKLGNTKPAYDIFLKNKPDSCYRIFVMGGSAAMGFPFEIGNSFSRILTSQLQDAFPHKKIEIINTAMAAVNSYTLLDLTDEILAQKPDAIVIYAGHNEYYGALGVGSVENGGNFRWLKMLHLKLIHLRTYQLIQHIIASITRKFSPEAQIKSTETLMARIVKDKEIIYGSKLYNDGIEQFSENINAILTKAKKAGVTVLISDLVSNIHDTKPFKSVATQKFPKAEDVFENAQKLEKSGDYENAKKEYYLAKDLDCIRFRASEDLNKAIIELGKKNNAIIVPMEYNFEKKSPHGFIGDNLMLEHLHCNIDGYFLMADVFFNAFRHAKLIDKNWDTTLIKPSKYYRDNWGFTPLDSLVGDLIIKKLKDGWPFKSDATMNLFKFTYKPKSYEDSIALNCIKYANVRIDKMHEKMALHYAKQGKYYSAFKEDYSLIKCYPFNSDLYIDGSDYLLRANEKQKACELLKTMPGLDTTYYALAKLGEIYLDLKQYKNAVTYLEKALKFTKQKDAKEPFLVLMYNAYTGVGNKDMANQILKRIKKINPNFTLSEANSANIGIVVLSATAINYIDMAKKSDSEGNYDNALELLYKANRIKESPYINFLIGNILFEKKDINALYYYEKVYPETPKDPDLLRKLSFLYIMQGNKVKALKMRNELNEVVTDKTIINNLTNLIAKMKNTKK